MRVMWYHGGRRFKSGEVDSLCGGRTERASARVGTVGRSQKGSSVCSVVETLFPEGQCSAPEASPLGQQ